MIIALLLLTLWISALLGATAWVVERSLRPAGIPTRLVWLASICASAGLVALAPLRAARSARSAEIAATIENANAIVLSPDLAGFAANASERLPSWLGAVLAALWCVASAVTIWIFAAGHRRHRRLAARAVLTRIAGTAVRVSESFGPAVIGIRRPSIVVPAWLRARPEDEQRLVIAHELEHLRTRDPVLLLIGAGAVALFPWNPIAWWCFDHLRNATELDCDARVLRAGAPASRYGALLIDLTAAQPAPTLGIGTPAFSNRPSLLERRLLAMTTRPVTSLRRRASLAASAALCALAFGSACSAEVKPPVAAETREAPTVVDANAALFDFQVETPASAIAGSAMPRYPAILRSSAIEGQVVAQFVVDTLGRIELGSFKAVKQTHDLFVQAVREAVPSMRFAPALVGGRKVRQVVQQPFVFQLSR